MRNFFDSTKGNEAVELTIEAVSGSIKLLSYDFNSIWFKTIDLDQPFCVLHLYNKAFLHGILTFA